MAATRLLRRRLNASSCRLKTYPDTFRTAVRTVRRFGTYPAGMMPIRLQLKNGTRFDFNPKNPFPPHGRIRHTFLSDGIRRRSGQSRKTARLRQPQLQSSRQTLHADKPSCRIYTNRQRLMVRRQISRPQNFRRGTIRHERLHRRTQNTAHSQLRPRNQYP